MEYVSHQDVLALMWIRRRAGWSLENMATSLGVSKSELSRMESGKRKMTKKLFQEAVLTLNIDWNFECYEELEDKFRLVNKFLYEMEPKRACDLLNEMLENKLYFRNSRQYFWWSLVDLFNEIIFKPNICLNNEMDVLEQEVHDFWMYFPEDIKILIIDLRYFKKGANDLDSLDYPIRDIGNATIAGTMLLFHRYQKMVKVSSFFDTMELYNRLENQLKQDRNFKRLIEVDILKSILFTRIGEFEAAEKILLQTYDLSNKISYKEPVRKIFENLMWNSIRSGKYLEFLLYLKKQNELYPDCLSGGNVILAPYCLFMLGEFEQANQGILWMNQNLRTNKFEEKTLLMIDDLIKDRPKMFIRHSESCLKEAKKNNDYEVVNLLLEIQVRFFENKGDWKNAYKKLIMIKNGKLN